MKQCKTTFDSREDLIDEVAALTPWLDDRNASNWRGGRNAAEEKLGAIKPVAYGRTRNFINGDVTYLSPYIRHGITNLNDVRNYALSLTDDPKKIEKFIQELGWRDYWQRIYHRSPEWIWNSAEEYKTGYSHDDYADELPDDIAKGETGVAALDHFIKGLLDTGYMHNHARMYVASYTVHWRKVKWQAGAKWFLHHLLYGDPASNNLSWQWVASTFGNKPYIFNLDNVRKYSPDDVDTSSDNNKPIDDSYDNLNKKLFPNKGDGS